MRTHKTLPIARIASILLISFLTVFLTACPGKKEEPPQEKAESMVPVTPPPAPPEGAAAPADPNAAPPAYPSAPEKATEGGTTNK